MFFKVDHICSAVEMEEKHEKSDKQTFQNQCLFSHAFFKDFGANLPGFWPPSWTPKNGFQLPFFQVAAKRRPRGAQEAPRASQGRLKSLQQPPKRAPRVPKSDQNVPRARPRCIQRVTFLRISLFFNVFCGSVFEEEKPQDQVKTAPRPLRTLQFRPNCTLKRPKTFPEAPQDPYESCPKTVQQNRHNIAP